MSKPDFFSDLKIPAVAAPMFLISGPKLVVECCKNGIVGTFPALNQRTTEGFEEWVIQIKKELDEFEKETGKKAAPFGVNLIVHNTNPRVKDDLMICVKHKVPIIITSLGAVSQLVGAVHSYGGLVYHDIIKKRHAEKAAEAGVDGMIVVSAGAGGHGGTLNPISLISEVRSFFKKTILLSGCISSGQDIASAMQMGADLAYMGTRFINTKESLADEDYKKMIIDSIKALETRDLDLANKVVEMDDEVDKLRDDLEQKAIFLIAREQPLAIDLRKIITALRVIMELERMGDYAEGIAKINLRIGETDLIKPLIDIPAMSKKSIEMMRNCLKAYKTSEN